MIEDLDLPPAVTDGGYIYVLQFTGDLIKVGSTRNPRKRIRTHHAEAQVFGAQLIDCWLSGPHRSYLDSEAKLIGLARPMATEVRRMEYFIGVQLPALMAAFNSWDGSAPATTKLDLGFGADDPLWDDLKEVEERTPDIPMTAADIKVEAAFRRRRLRGVA